MPRKKVSSENEIEVKKENVKQEYIHAVGRRKEAVARVRLYPNVKSGLAWDNQEIKKGDVLVNKLPIEKYFSGEVAKVKYTEPLRVVNMLGKHALTIRVEGGGLSGQLDAVILGISRALAKLESGKFRPALKQKGFLTRDARVRERRKVGMGGKSRRKRQSPKR
ncbi:MAG: 30S ribosomal protein S9 [Patescibacteria group bacterium]|nr:30S ribosomal protein S9 [Patescibacteria group bacterium]